MENQHRKITGYRELNQAELDLINRIKEKGKELSELVNDLRMLPNVPDGRHDPLPGLPIDQRGVSIGATHLQEGLMALTRAVAKPEFF